MSNFTNANKRCKAELRASAVADGTIHESVSDYAQPPPSYPPSSSATAGKNTHQEINKQIDNIRHGR